MEEYVLLFLPILFTTSPLQLIFSLNLKSKKQSANFHLLPQAENLQEIFRIKNV